MSWETNFVVIIPKILRFAFAKSILGDQNHLRELQIRVSGVYIPGNEIFEDQINLSTKHKKFSIPFLEYPITTKLLLFYTRSESRKKLSFLFLDA